EAAPTGFVLWLSFRSGYDGLLRYPLSPTLSREGEGSFILFMLRRSLKSLPDPPFGKGRGFRSFHRRGGIWKSLPGPPFGKGREFRSLHRRGGSENLSSALPLEKGRSFVPFIVEGDLEIPPRPSLWKREGGAASLLYIRVRFLCPAPPLVYELAGGAGLPSLRSSPL